MERYRVHYCAMEEAQAWLNSQAAEGFKLATMQVIRETESERTWLVLIVEKEPEGSMQFRSRR